MDTNDNLRRTADGPLETATVPRPYRSDGGRPLGTTDAIAAPETFVKRISWGAILAGVVMALVIQLAFSLLGLVSSVVSAAGQGAAHAEPGLVDAAKQKLQEGGVDLSNIQGQVDQLLRQTGTPQLQPENLQNRSAGAVTQAENAAQDPNQDVKGIVNRAFAQNGDVANAVDRDALVNVIMNRTGKSRPEAEQIVAGYQRTFQQAQAKAQQLGEQAKAQAQKVADATRKSAAKVALAATLALILGALAAALGGRAGTPREFIGVTSPARV